MAFAHLGHTHRSPIGCHPLAVFCSSLAKATPNVSLHSKHVVTGFGRRGASGRTVQSIQSHTSPTLRHPAAISCISGSKIRPRNRFLHLSQIISVRAHAPYHRASAQSARNVLKPRA
jgi:hypothetical protein